MILFYRKSMQFLINLIKASRKYNLFYEVTYLVFRLLMINIQSLPVQRPRHWSCRRRPWWLCTLRRAAGCPCTSDCTLVKPPEFNSYSCVLMYILSVSKFFRKSVLYLFKYTANLYLRRYSTDLRYILGHSVEQYVHFNK